MIVSFLIGLLLGGLYFGGLYYSTQSLNHKDRPGVFMILSSLIRMGVLILGLYYLAKRGLKDILIGGLAIIIVRFVMVTFVKKQVPDLKKERGESL